jgi:hypothetical protein
MPLTGWDTAARARLAGENVEVALLLRIDAVSGPLRYWIGDFDFPVAADEVVEDAAAIYSGLGEIAGTLPALNQLLNGQADRLTFTLSGVMAEVLALAADEADEVQGRAINLGFCCLDQDLQVCTPVAWVGTLEGQFVTVDRAQATDGEPVRTLSLTATTVFAVRQQAACSYYTDAEQRRRSSDDTFFARIAAITRGKTRKFGPTDA